MSVVLHLYNMYHVNSHNCLVLLHIIPHECLFVNCSHFGSKCLLDYESVMETEDSCDFFLDIELSKKYTS